MYLNGIATVQLCFLEGIGECGRRWLAPTDVWVVIPGLYLAMYLSPLHCRQSLDTLVFLA